MNNITKVLKEAIQSVLPIFAIVLFLSVTVASMGSGVVVTFLFGTLFLIFGMVFFTIGSTISMEPLGEGIGVTVGKLKRPIVPIILCFGLGIIITIAEPDLSVLAGQLDQSLSGDWIASVANALNVDARIINQWIIILSVAFGVGTFLAISYVRSRKGIKLNTLLLIFYGIMLCLSIFVPKEFVPTSFDSGGVTTGPITVPFIMALGAGIASISTSKNARENSFGLIALCSVGPIIAVMIIGCIFKPTDVQVSSSLYIPESSKEAFNMFLTGVEKTVDGKLIEIEGVKKYAEEVLVALAPLLGFLVIFQLITKRFTKHQLIRMVVGFIYTYIGLVFFLTGANVGFMPAGRLIGEKIASGNMKLLLVPLGALMGYFVVSAEPAVHSLKKQVEEITNGSVSQKSIGLALSIGVACSIGIAMMRVLFDIKVLPILAVGYVISLVISFFVPPIYTGIAFDSGGVASGPMATTFILPFAIGACSALGKSVLEFAFGVVAMIAMTPLIAIQVLGLIGEIKRKKHLAQTKQEILSLEDDMIYYEEVA